MVSPNARAALEMEIKLIDELTEATLKFAANASTPLETEIINGWNRGLNKRKEINKFYIKLSDPHFDKEATDEITILKSLRASLGEKQGKVAVSWIEHIEEDIVVMADLKG